MKEAAGLLPNARARSPVLAGHNIQIAPVVKTGGDEMMGITLDLQGLEFSLLTADHDVTGTGRDKALYRPAAFVFDMGGARHRIQFSWEDCLPRQDVIITWKK